MASHKSREEAIKNVARLKGDGGQEAGGWGLEARRLSQIKILI